MGNTVGSYDQIYYAQEGLAVLYKALGLARRVYRRLDGAAREIGSTVTFRRPSTFTAETMPDTPSDLSVDTVTLSVNQWYGKTIKLTDQELSYTKERIFADHVAPIANSVALAIDASLQALVRKVPWYVTATSPLAVADITGARKILASNGAPMNDGQLYLMLSPTLEEEALRNSAFSQWQGAGQQGADTQASGLLGGKFGFSSFMTPTTITQTAGVAADATGAMNAQALKGATTIVVKSVTSGATVNAGDTLVIAGNTQRYSVTTNATDGNSDGVISLEVTPPLVQTYEADAVVTINLVSGEQSLAFHRDVMALVMGQLPAPTTQGANADIFTAIDEPSGLSLRARRWYDPNTAVHKLSVDALWGVAMLNGNLGVRIVD